MYCSMFYSISTITHHIILYCVIISKLQSLGRLLQIEDVVTTRRAKPGEHKQALCGADRWTLQKYRCIVFEMRFDGYVRGMFTRMSGCRIRITGGNDVYRYGLRLTTRQSDRGVRSNNNNSNTNTN